MTTTPKAAMFEIKSNRVQSLMHLLEFVQSSMCCIVRRRPSWGTGLESFVGLWA
ncbi:hypothetical protein Gohar_021019, partial [Gossypium harknessii]|nr:hypothetical protein [Gossypium harknessii]